MTLILRLWARAVSLVRGLRRRRARDLRSIALGPETSSLLEVPPLRMPDDERLHDLAREMHAKIERGDVFRPLVGAAAMGCEVVALFREVESDVDYAVCVVPRYMEGDRR